MVKNVSTNADRPAEDGQTQIKVCKFCCSWSHLTPIFKHYSIIGAIGGVIAILCVFWAAIDASVSKWLVAFWSVAPPVWFFFEFHWAKNTGRNDLEDIQKSQEYAQKIWAGVVAALTILFLK